MALIFNKYLSSTRTVSLSVPEHAAASVPETPVQFQQILRFMTWAWPYSSHVFLPAVTASISCSVQSMSMSLVGMSPASSVSVTLSASLSLLWPLSHVEPSGLQPPPQTQQPIRREKGLLWPIRRQRERNWNSVLFFIHFSQYWHWATICLPALVQTNIRVTKGATICLNSVVLPALLERIF